VLNFRDPSESPAAVFSLAILDGVVR